MRIAVPAIFLISSLCSAQMESFFDVGKLPYLKRSKLIQLSSNDSSGGNKDYVTLGTGSSRIIADIKGAGVITRIWLTISAADRFFLRRVLLRMYWDDEDSPSVECPVGDFFGNGFQYTQWTSLLLGMSSGGYYCYFPMPFARSARIEVVNESGRPVNSLHYQIDYQKLDSLENVGRFHAQWRRDVRTSSGENYVVLEAEGKGQYVGTILEMQGLKKDLSFLEGDENVFVDGEATASIKGTGTEDYFSSGWYFSKGTYSAPLHGLILKDDTSHFRIVAYRFHLGDQIPFQRNIRFTIEHGHANKEVSDYSSVAFWYQEEPHKKFHAILAANRRIPLRAVIPPGAVEAEDLLGSAQAIGGRLESEDMSALGPDWGNDRQLVFRADREGARFTLTIPVKEPDVYSIAAYFTRDGGYGRMSASIGGKIVGEFDGYGRETLPGAKVLFDKVRIVDSSVTLTFTVVGKNASSSGLNAGLDALVLSPQKNFVRDWFVIGPFNNPGDNADRKGLTIPYPPEKEFSKKSYSGKDGEKVRWRFFSGSDDGYVDLNDALKPHELAVAYALSYVYSPRKTDSRIYVGSDDGVRLWMNHRLVHDHAILRPADPDQDTVTVSLAKGWNKILFKIENNLGGWGFFCRIPNPLGELSFSPSQSSGARRK